MFVVAIPNNGRMFNLRCIFTFVIKFMIFFYILISEQEWLQNISKKYTYSCFNFPLFFIFGNIYKIIMDYVNESYENIKYLRYIFARGI